MTGARPIVRVLVVLALALCVGLAGFVFYLKRIDAGWAIHDGYLIHQSFMSLVNGDGLRGAFNVEQTAWPPVHYFRIHARWNFYPLGLLYLVAPHIETTLFVQTLLISLALAALAILSGPLRRGAVAAALLATSAPFWGLVFSGAHMESTAVCAFPVVALLVLARWEDRGALWWKALLVASVAWLLSLKEDMPLLLLGWSAVGAVLDRERRRLYVVLACVSLFVATVDQVAIHLAARGHETLLGPRFGWLFGDSASADFGAGHQWEWRRTYLAGTGLWLLFTLVAFRGKPLARWLPTFLVAVVATLENLSGAYLGHLYLIGHYQVMLVAALAVLAALAIADAKRSWLVAGALLILSAVTWSQSSLTGWIISEKPSPVMVRGDVAQPRGTLACLEAETPWTHGERYAVTGDLVLLARPAGPIEDLDELAAANALPDYVLANVRPRLMTKTDRTITPADLERLLAENYAGPVEVCGSFLLFTKRR